MKTSSEQTTRLLYQLRHNLIPKSETQQIKDYSDEAKDIIRREGFGEVVKSFNYSTTIGYDKFCLEDFENAELFPDDEFAMQYQNKHTIYPVGIGAIVPIEQWRQTSRKIKMNLSDETDGSVFGSIASRDSRVHLDEICFMILSRGRKLSITKEHELIHVDNNVYSTNDRILGRFNQGIRFEGTYIQDRVENRIKKELIAYRNELVGETEDMIVFLSDILLGSYVNNLVSYISNPIVRRATAIVLNYKLRPLKLKIKSATEAMEYLTKEIPSKLLTPLLFSIGPTLEEIERGKRISTLNDVVRLADAYSKKELKAEQIFEEIKNKGYSIN